jgi:hypothetical protein
MIRTVTYDDSTHKICPIEPTEDQLLKMHECMYDVRKMAWHDGLTLVYKVIIAAAPEYQEPVKTMICKRCGADRFKEHCKQPDVGCPMVVTALGSKEYQEPTKDE